MISSIATARISTARSSSPALGLNYFFPGTGLKLSAMYQYTGRWKHKTQLDRDNDDLGIATHSAAAAAILLLSPHFLLRT